MKTQCILFACSHFCIARSEPSADYGLQVSDNSGCANAFPVDNNQELFSGSTAAAVVTDIATPLCSSASVGVSPGVWFEVEGDGTSIEASACGGASFDTQISIYTGSCGSSLECVTGNNDFCGTQSSVIWFSQVRLTLGCSLVSSPLDYHSSLPAFRRC
jgi:hypothetical protein